MKYFLMFALTVVSLMAQTPTKPADLSKSDGISFTPDTSTPTDPTVQKLEDKLLSEPPTEAETHELLNRIEKKLAKFESEVKTMSPRVEPLLPDWTKETLSLVANTRQAMKGMQTGQPNAYALAVLLASVDDLSFEAGNTAVALALQYPGGNADFGTMQDEMIDMHDLGGDIAHPTLRLIKSNDVLMEKVAKLLDQIGQQPVQPR
jgi:hypothetical protein